MRDHLRRASGFFAAVAAVPLLVGLIGSWSMGLAFLLFLILLPAALILHLVYGIGLARRGFAAARGERGWRRLVTAGFAPAMIAAVLLAALPAIGLGNYGGTWLRLAVKRGHYDEIVADVRLHPHRRPAIYRNRGVSFQVDRGPPLRIAFEGQGFLDNWSAIVFDPTGDVMLAQGMDATGRFVAPSRVTRLFGGDLVGCRPLGGDYYLCSFT